MIANATGETDVDGDGKCSIYRALTLVKSGLVRAADARCHRSRARTAPQTNPPVRARLHARHPSTREMLQEVMRRSSGARSVCWTIRPTRVTTETRMESQRLPQIHSERSYCVVCLVLVFTTVRFQSAMLGKKCFSFSKQHNVLVLCVTLPHRCKLIGNVYSEEDVGSQYLQCPF